MPWFQDYRDISEARKGADEKSKFAAYTLTSPDSPKIQKEITDLLTEESKE